LLTYIINHLKNDYWKLSLKRQFLHIIKHNPSRLQKQTSYYVPGRSGGWIRKFAFP